MKITIWKVMRRESPVARKLLRGGVPMWEVRACTQSHRLEMTEWGWADENLGDRTEGLGTNRIRELRVSQRSKWPPVCCLG